MSTFAKSTYFVRTAFGSLLRSPFVHAISVASLSLALIGFGAARLARWQLDALLGTLTQDVELTAYLEPSATTAQVNALATALEQRTGGLVRRVSAQQALERLARDLGEDRKLIEDVGDNVLPDSLELKLSRGARSADELAELVKQTRTLDFVNAVDFSQDSVMRVELISKALNWAAALAFVLVFLTAVVVVSATLQLAIFSRRGEIEIQKLVGATDIFVRIPFLLEGLMQGALAASIAVVVVLALGLSFEFQQTALLSFLRVGGHLVADWPRLFLELFLIGTMLGLLGSFIAVRRFLKV